jgi:hypothetical protein
MGPAAPPDVPVTATEHLGGGFRSATSPGAARSERAGFATGEPDGNDDLTRRPIVAGEAGVTGGAPEGSPPRERRLTTADDFADEYEAVVSQRDVPAEQRSVRLEALQRMADRRGIQFRVGGKTLNLVEYYRLRANERSRPLDGEPK